MCVCVSAGLRDEAESQRSTGALCRPQRSEGAQHTPTSSTNAPLSCQYTTNRTRRTSTLKASRLNSRHVNALPCDDEASDDELRPNFAPLSQWALHSGPLSKFPSRQHTIGEGRRGMLGLEEDSSYCCRIGPAGGQLEQRDAAWQRATPEHILWTFNSRECWGNREIFNW